jgi:hypothetical protein
MIPTPWIKGYDPAQEYLGGHAQGVQIGEANARITNAAQALQQQAQQHAQQMQMEQQRLQMSQEQSQQRHLEELQNLEIQKSYRDMQLTMQKRQLDTANQRMQMLNKQAADQLVAQHDFEKDLSETQAANPNMSRNDAWAQVISRHPFVKLNPGTLNYLEKVSNQAFVPKSQTLADGTKVLELAPGKFSQAKTAAKDTIDPWDHLRITENQKRIDAIENRIVADGLMNKPKKLAEARKAEEEFKIAINNIERQNGKPLSFPEVTSSVGKYDAQGNFVPAKKAEEEKGSSWMSDTWNAIKGAPASILGAVTGSGEEAMPQPGVIPQAPVVPEGSGEHEDPQMFQAPNLSAPAAAPTAAAPSPWAQAAPPGFAPPPPGRRTTAAAPQAQNAGPSSPIDVIKLYRMGRISKTQAEDIIDQKWPDHGIDLKGPEWDTSSVSHQIKRSLTLTGDDDPNNPPGLLRMKPQEGEYE